MAKKSKTPRYDLKAADRKRNMLIQIGLTAVVIVFAVALVLYIVSTKKDKVVPNAGQAVRVESSSVVKDDGGQPKAVLSLYEDFLCPACAQFEAQFGPTISQLIDSGAAAVDYYLLGNLDTPQRNYSSLAGAAAYCVADADPSKAAFRKFHASLYDPAIQPSETAASYPDNAQLIEYAKNVLPPEAGATVTECINSGRYVAQVEGAGPAAGVLSTPTVLINGQQFDRSSPQALVDKIKEIVGELPTQTAPPPPAPAAPPAPAPAAP